MSEYKEDPCGMCDIGIYSEMSALNKKARAFGALSEKERCKNMPVCKKNNHICYGAKHYHESIVKIDKFLESKLK